MNKTPEGKQIMLTLNSPIVIFYGCLLRHGVALSIVDGALHVGGEGIDNLSPIYRAEIIKRKDHLIELLETGPPAPLLPYFWRLLAVGELVEALGIAEQMKVRLQQTPVSGGWIVTMGQHEKATA